ncbi:unnamed protein product [Adineta ricciae]|uniref:Uncharacterized protein n=1 Tax=Adineta ricciae TaxID=249248 RepID=A0A815BIB0_ADIRI|nr:unnamed protein product [Adineta ricciae]CAF1269933.1 unnamed protein product [Adineta ricciae]
MASTKRHNEICDECDIDATWYCVQDNANYCDEHNTIAHTLKSQKSHQIVPIHKKHHHINENYNSKPMDCKVHHMPLCLYCLTCQDVCCVACLSVDIHKQHSDQVKSVVDLIKEEKDLLNKHLKRIQKLKIAFVDEQDQLEQALRNIHISQTEGEAKIDREFDQIQAYLQIRRQIMKKQLEKKSKTSCEKICSRQDELSSINSNINRCFEEGQHLNALMNVTQSIHLIERMKRIEKENVEFCNQTQLGNSLTFHISNQAILKMIDTLGFIGSLPTVKFLRDKCKSYVHHLDIEWDEIDDDDSVINDYVLQVGQDDNDFQEVYRGLDTKYRLLRLRSDTLYSLRLFVNSNGEMQTPTILEMRTLKIDLNDWTLSMSSTYELLNAENTRESLLDDHFTTGAATDYGTSWIKASFSYPVLVNGITIAPLHKDINMWDPRHGNSGSVQYSNDSMNWTTIGTIEYVPNEKQKINVGGITASYWRLFHNNYLGTSCLIFE